MHRSKLIDELNNLIQLDIDAVRAYSQALGSVKDPEVVKQLTAFRADHERHVTELGALVRAAGGDPAHSPDLKGFFIEGMTAIRAMAGELAALKAMRDNERLTNRKYEAALQFTGLPDDVRAVIAANREDERRHLAWIEARVARGAMA